MFGLWKRKAKVGGEIAYHQLEDWWFSTFTAEQREQAAGLYKPMGGSERPLVEGEIRWSSASRVKFLTFVSSWFSKPGTRDIALAFADKLASEINPETPAVERHFAYQSLCTIYYRWRDEVPGCFDKAVSTCEASVAMAHELGGVIQFDTGAPEPVSHYCYRQLVVIEKKRGNFERAISLCRQAISEGWRGDWDHRIASMQKAQARGQRHNAK